MNYKKCLIFQIFTLLQIIENEENQAIIKRIEGLLNALKDEV